MKHTSPLTLLFASIIPLLMTGCLTVMPMLAPEAEEIEPNISAEFPYESKFVEVNGSRMHYVEQGEGEVMVLLHGNPTSSYLWRNVIPRLSPHGRVIAVDMIGLGKSEKPKLGYTFDDHATYFAGFMKALGLTNVTLVLHDWGGGVGLDWAAKNSDKVRGVAVMEAVLRPMSWEEADAPTRYLFKRLRDPEDGHEILAEDNYFIETMLPMMSGRDLSDKEMAVYRKPFPTVESRKPVAMWPREIPIDNTPPQNAKRIGANYQWLRQATSVPVLLVYADPGMIITEDYRVRLKKEIPRISMVSIGSGIHYIQEVQPTKIGDSVASWFKKLPASTPAP